MDRNERPSSRVRKSPWLWIVTGALTMGLARVMVELVRFSETADEDAAEAVRYAVIFLVSLVSSCLIILAVIYVAEREPILQQRRLRKTLANVEPVLIGLDNVVIDALKKIVPDRPGLWTRNWRSFNILLTVDETELTFWSCIGPPRIIGQIPWALVSRVSTTDIFRVWRNVPAVSLEVEVEGAVVTLPLPPSRPGRIQSWPMSKAEVDRWADELRPLVAAGRG